MSKCESKYLQYKNLPEGPANYPVKLIRVPIKKQEVVVPQSSKGQQAHNR